MSRLSVSRRTWSHQLPCSLSAGLSGLQCVSFFPHKGPGFVGLDLLGSDVLNHSVVEELGVFSRFVGESQDGVEGDTAQATGGTHPVALDQMMSNVQSLLVAHVEAKQRRALAF